MMLTVIDRDGQPIALPNIARLVERIQTHRAARLVVHETDSVQRSRIVVALIPIVAREQRLLVHEYLVA
jgi:hypothetical protein